mgnify:CR=1 FL=1
MQPVCQLAAYLLTTLPQDVAICLFQCFAQRVLPIWLKPNSFQTVRSMPRPEA